MLSGPVLCARKEGAIHYGWSPLRLDVASFCLPSQPSACSRACLPCCLRVLVAPRACRCTRYVDIHITPIMLSSNPSFSKNFSASSTSLKGTRALISPRMCPPNWRQLKYEAISAPGLKDLEYKNGWNPACSKQRGERPTGRSFIPSCKLSIEPDAHLHPYGCGHGCSGRSPQ